MAMSDDLKAVKAEVEERLQSIDTPEALEALRVEMLGRKGRLTALMHMMGKVPTEERPAMGKLANTVRSEVEAAISARKEVLEHKAMEALMEADAVDITLPGHQLSLGTQHLISQIREEIEDIFCDLGYTVEDGPYVETTWYNFTALNAPEDHPSRSARDTFYVVDNAPEGKESHVQGESDVLLRTQTSGVQVHVMEKQQPPIYMICPGKVFRPDTADANHLPQFTQVEGLVVDEGITFGDLKGTLPSALLPVYGAQLRGRRLLRRLRRQGLPLLQEHGLARDFGLRHGRPQRIRVLRHRPRALHRVCLRYRCGACCGAALRPA
jgi:phenylalanyl-tRNA synthetase alpha chain